VNRNIEAGTTTTNRGARGARKAMNITSPAIPNMGRTTAAISRFIIDRGYTTTEQLEEYLDKKLTSVWQKGFQVGQSSTTANI